MTTGQATLGQEMDLERAEHLNVDDEPIERHGRFLTRIHVSPEEILQLLDIPEGFTAKAVYHSEERDGFAIILEAPNDQKWFVLDQDIIPITPARKTVTTDEEGYARMKIRFEGLTSDTGTPSE